MGSQGFNLQISKNMEFEFSFKLSIFPKVKISLLFKPNLS